MSTTAATPQRTRKPRPSRRTDHQDQRVAAAPVRGRPRPLVIAAGVALIIVGILATWFVVNSQSQTSLVLAVAHPVARGEEITSADLTSLEVADTAAGAYLSTGDQESVLGQTALVDLTTNTPLTTDNVGELAVSGGNAIVGVPLTSAQMPSTEISAGDRVSIVSTASNAAESGTEPVYIDGTVFSVRFDEVTSLNVVDLTVDADAARLVASMASAGEVALVVLPAGE